METNHEKINSNLERFDAAEWAEWFPNHSQMMYSDPENYTLSIEMKKRRSDETDNL